MGEGFKNSGREKVEGALVKKMGKYCQEYTTYVYI